MADIKKLVQRSKKVAFYKVGDKYERMKVSNKKDILKGAKEQIK